MRRVQPTTKSTCAALGVSTRDASADGPPGRWWVGGRIGGNFPAENKSGELRVDEPRLELTVERRIEAERCLLPTLTLGYDVKRWRKYALSLELEAPRFETKVSDTGWADPDASTIIVLPAPRRPRSTGTSGQEACGSAT